MTANKDLFWPIYTFIWTLFLPLPHNYYQICINLNNDPIIPVIWVMFQVHGIFIFLLDYKSIIMYQLNWNVINYFSDLLH